MKKIGGLGRGLGALGLEENSGLMENNSLEISIQDIDTNPQQPRKNFEETALEELAESIRLHGVVQPILVKQKGSRFMIVAGERRFRAARKAGLTKIPVLVTKIDEREIAEVSLIENIQREDLNPLEEAGALRFLMEQHDLTQEEVSRRVGKSRSAIANSLRLLDLPSAIQEKVAAGMLSAGHGKMLAGIPEKERQENIAARAEKEAWSVRQLEEFLREAESKQAPPAKKKAPRSAELADMEGKLCEILGTHVTIRGSETKGKIEIAYASVEELEKLIEALLK
ncbi:MAG: ParB/RepB/Spo0J family partition protein [Clostridiales bacterium]|nr:ParB/RepB/Spo0J family partition protein [Clostridiales bacterium]